MAVARQAVAANTAAVDLARVLARGFSIYNESFQRAYPTANQEFIVACGISIDEYFACVVAIALRYANILPDKQHEESGIFHVHKIQDNLRPEMAPVLDKYFELESQTADELRASLCRGRKGSTLPIESDPYDYLPLRNRPILRAADGRAIILDPLFYGEKTSVGPLFPIVRVIRGTGRDNTAFGAFGASFEAYVHDLLRAMYPNGGGLLSSRLSCNPHGKMSAGDDVEFADACLNDVTEIILFEAKATFIREDRVLDQVEGTYLDALRAQYAAFNIPGERDKGAGQLARSIRDLASGKLVPSDQDLSRVRTIFPVLIVHDTALNGPGHAEFLGGEFTKALGPDELLHNGYTRKGRFTVAPMVLMTIEDLENLQSSVQNFRLLDLLRDYTHTVSDGARPSFHDFIAASRSTYRLIHSKELTDRAIKVLVHVARALFPAEALEDFGVGKDI